MQNTQKIIVIGGPTGSGKSALALELARHVLAQDKQPVIINADSMQVYKEIPLITAQPSHKEQEEVPHRLYGALPASESCSAGKWIKMAAEEINQAFANKKLPILAGGTGLYIKSLIYGIARIPDIDEEIHSKAIVLQEKLGTEQFYLELTRKDPKIKDKIDKANPKRALRAWEVYEQTGISFTQWHEQETEPEFPEEKYQCFFLNRPREDIYNNVNERFKNMVSNGIVEEVSKLMAQELPSSLPAMKAHGVPEIIKYLRGEIPLEQAIEKAQQNTRNYVKRQITWFTHQLPSFKLIASADEIIEEL